MSKLTLNEISEKMRDIDICMMTTKTVSGQLESRPMSNNRDVDYKGDSYFFAYDDCSAAQEIKMDPSVGLSLVHQAGILGKSLYISITGKADLIYDRATMEKHWVKELNLWFKDGLDTPGIVLIHVKASHLKYWHGMDEGELSV